MPILLAFALAAPKASMNLSQASESGDDEVTMATHQAATATVDGDTVETCIKQMCPLCPR